MTKAVDAGVSRGRESIGVASPSGAEVQVSPEGNGVESVKGGDVGKDDGADQFQSSGFDLPVESATNKAIIFPLFAKGWFPGPHNPHMKVVWWNALAWFIGYVGLYSSSSLITVIANDFGLCDNQIALDAGHVKHRHPCDSSDDCSADHFCFAEVKMCMTKDECFLEPEIAVLGSTAKAAKCTEMPKEIELETECTCTSQGCKGFVLLSEAIPLLSGCFFRLGILYFISSWY